MFILYGLYSLVRSGGPCCMKFSDSILAKVNRFFSSAFSRSLSMDRLILSPRRSSWLRRLSSGVFVPLLVFPLVAPLVPFPSVPEPVSVSDSLSLELSLRPFNFWKGFLRNDIFRWCFSRKSKWAGKMLGKAIFLYESRSMNNRRPRLIRCRRCRRITGNSVTIVKIAGYSDARSQNQVVSPGWQHQNWYQYLKN